MSKITLDHKKEIWESVMKLQKVLQDSRQLIDETKNIDEFFTRYSLGSSIFQIGFFNMTVTEVIFQSLDIDSEIKIFRIGCRQSVFYSFSNGNKVFNNHEGECEDKEKFYEKIFYYLDQICSFEDDPLKVKKFKEIIDLEILKFL